VFIDIFTVLCHVKKNTVKNIGFIYTYIYIHTHTHTYIYMYYTFLPYEKKRRIFV